MKTRLLLPFMILLALTGVSMGQTMPFLGNNASIFILYTSDGALDNIGASNVYGKVGTLNSGEYSGFSGVVIGEEIINIDEAIPAKVELSSAYTNFKNNVSCVTPLSSTLAGPLTLVSDTYCTAGATSITGEITLDGGNNPNAVFLFKIGGLLTFGNDAKIILTKGAKESNVYFQVDGAVNVGTDAIFRGTIVADGAIDLGENATVYGKVLSLTSAVHLHNNLIASTENQVLPVTLVSFNATKSENNTAFLTWTTTSETNSDRFEIENSLTGKDWRTAGSVKAQGESKKLLSYTYSAESIGTGINFYRLKMIDSDESFTYSRIRSVEFSTEKRTVMYPNPAVDKIILDVDDINLIERVQFNDINGRVVYDKSKSGASNLTGHVDIKNFPAGMYVVRITRATGIVTYLKILKQ